MSSAISVEKVWKRYGDFVAVADLTFDVPRGGIYGLLGPNGAGKSTTLRMINDIIGADEGQIRILGKFSPGREAARHIGYLPEERGLYPKMRVVELLQFFAELRGVSASDGKKRAIAWLERLELADWAAKKVEDLSKGMQQKVQFATAVIHEPELLILDEPWSGLDPINAEVLREVVDEQRKAGRTVVFSTHLMEQAEKLCDRVCIISRGKKILEGGLEAIKREAGGDRRVVLRFGEGDEDRAQTLLGESSLVAEVSASRVGHVVELAPDAAPPALLALLSDSGVELRRFEIYEPSLHEIFVERVGEAVLDAA